ncbi:MAG: hypothetical protein CVU69_00340 [Deltaproteobacteria bacterium HGW-Deltaproteobacteria-4]|nr:MAG: hypothetical protein CVU69_00340 [Deltaproteobacteria bacterium HGW-Deltaproteobacteria-4]
MKKFGFLLAGLMTAGVLTLAGCGGGGGGGGGEPTVAATTFNMIELAGFDGSEFSAGIAINDNGLAVGFSDNGTSIRGAKWMVTDASPAAATVLPPLDGNSYSAAYGVNAAGVSVGESGVNTDTNTVAVYWADSTPVALRLDTSGINVAGPSAAFSINIDGEIVGEAVNDAGNTVAIYWESNTAAPLILDNLTGGDFSSAYFIGVDGRIVGEAEGDNSKTKAVVWMPMLLTAGYDDPIVLDPVDNQSSSVALGVDKFGRIVGEVELASGVIEGVVWNANGSVAKSLGANTSLQAINDSSRMVGYSEARSGSDISSIWSVANILDKKSLAVAFSQAYGINAGNQVVGVSGTQAFAALPQ